MVVHNLRQRGVEFDSTVSAGVAALSEPLNALLAGGSSTKTAEVETFTRQWTSYVTGSNAKLPGQETTFAALAEGV